jgi:1-deoxy-D-xylulose-5-phosphate reductoisomerase
MTNSNLKNIVILGSTGSIGRQAIDVVGRRPDLYKVIGLAARSDWETLITQIDIVEPSRVCLVDERAAAELGQALAVRGTAKKIEILCGQRGLEELAAAEEADTVLNAIVGSAGLAATLAIIEAGKRLALANKESLVAAGDMVNKALQAHADSSIIPVDSEHSALWQCLVGEDIDRVERLILTASGGPFWGWDKNKIAGVTPDQALKHPRWNMGKRITIDSATLMNKGFEIIEAHHLFGTDYDRLDVLVHPQSIIHSLVEFVDGSHKAQLGPTDMRLPRPVPFDLAEVGKLEFYELERGWAPCFDLALAAGRSGRSYPAVLNAADEVAVAGFLSGLIGFSEIGNIIDAVLDGHESLEIRSIEDFEQVDGWARETARASINSFVKRGF